MYYGLIVFAALLFSTQFTFNNGYQRENGTGWSPTVKLSLYTSIFGFLITLAINKLSFGFSWFSLAIAVVYSLVCIALNYCTIKTFEYANLSMYTMFSMIGGMLLPFVYGIICGEELKPIKLLCFVMIICSILLMAEKSEKSKKAFPYCMAVFVLNGSVGVLSKLHQSFTEYCVDSGSFLMLTKLVTIFICVIDIIKTKDFKISLKSGAYCVGIAGFNCIGNLFLLIALLNLPASVQYPMVTGGTIVFSVIIDLIRKTGISKRTILAAVIAFAAVCMMVI